MSGSLIGGGINLGIGIILTIIAFVLYRKKSNGLKGAMTACL